MRKPKHYHMIQEQISTLADSIDFYLCYIKRGGAFMSRDWSHRPWDKSDDAELTETFHRIESKYKILQEKCAALGPASGVTMKQYIEYFNSCNSEYHIYSLSYLSDLLESTTSTKSIKEI